MKVPTLYNFIGYRLQVALEAVLRSNNGTDSSINMRNELAEKAIYAWKNNIYLGRGIMLFRLFIMVEDIIVTIITMSFWLVLAWWVRQYIMRNMCLYL